jgi:REP element-mobilizing transposase RayT
MKSHPGHLPQWRVPGAVYFITWRLHRWEDKLSEAERTIVLDTILFFNHQRYELGGLVVMDDHVHVIVQPIGEWTLTQILHSWKSFTAKEINKLRGQTGTRWMKDSRTEVIRNDHELRAKMEYIYGNPARRWPCMKDSPWMRFFEP